MKHTLEAINICKVFESPRKISILEDISLSLAPGQSVAIIGPSGVGKTTLLHVLATLEMFSDGQLFLAGHNVLKENCAQLRNRHIGFVFQNFHLLEEYTVLDNILMPAYIGRKSIRPTSAIYEHARSLLQQVDLIDRKDFLSKQLSGGEKQRVAIARALCNNPDIIFADEPTGNLDDTNSAIIHTALLNCCKKMGKALVVVTHDLSLAKLCNRTYKLEGGKLHFFPHENCKIR